jgi:hypothetical protein
MTVVQRTVAAVLDQHHKVLEQALEKMTTRWPVEEFIRESHRVTGGVVVHDEIRHIPSGFVFYIVETTCDDTGYQTRGWVPE